MALFGWYGNNRLRQSIEAQLKTALTATLDANVMALDIWMTNQTELAGLGMLRWLNGGQQTPTTMHYSFMNQDNLPWYMEGRLNSASPLQIPAFIALASSQVEGTGLIAKDISVISSFSQAISKLSSVGSWSDFTSALGPLGTPPVDSTPHLIRVYINNNTVPLIYH